jgi:beta-lactamase class A
MDFKVFQKVFTDLDLVKPEITQNQYPVTAKDFSQFMKVLYNASYLSIKNSEYCTELMSKTDFTKGIISGIPVGTKVIDKFGEGGFSDDKHLSESAIVFLNNSAYLLTVMTEGKDMNKLPEVIRSISAVVYKDMTSFNFASL